jgi:serine protease Do
MRKWGLLGLSVCLLGITLPGSAQQSQVDSLRQDIEVARQKVYPALVNISVVMRYFTGGRAQRSPAGGSGVIVDKDGHVLTNYHVAGHTTRITCTLPDGESFDADVIAHDPLTDLSVLKLRLDRRADPSAPLPFATLGDSDALQVGEHVLAMGNPLMLSSSMTLGIVSNTKRVFTDFTGTEMADMDLDDGEKTGLFTRWIQHDALILPGNSGGPLVNLKGEVVGINELGQGGVGFAIPSNIAKQVLQQALQGAAIQRGWLGITVLPVQKMDRTTGALVSAIAPDSPAARAGLAPGDILLSLDGEPVNARFFEEVPVFYQRVAALPAGKTVQMQYLRGSETRMATATVAPMERYLGEEEEFRDMGLTVQEITGPMALVHRFPDKNGVLVTGVRPGYPFESAQPPLAEDDVILTVGDQPITDLASFRKALTAADKKQISVTFRRNDEALVTVIKANPETPAEEGGELPKAWLGVKTQVVTPDVARAMKRTDLKGFRVTEVYPLTEASKAGLQPGDVITAINNDKLDASRPQDAEDLRRTIEDLTIGKKADLTLLRAGKPLKISVLMEAEPEASAQAKKARQKEFEFSVRDITAMDRMEQRWIKDQKGVFVTEATTGGWANISGLEIDDLILAINGKPVPDVPGFEQTMQDILAKKPRNIQIFVQRGYRTHFVFIEPDWKKLGDGDTD